MKYAEKKTFAILSSFLKELCYMPDRMLYNQMSDNFAVLIAGNLKLPLLTVKFFLGKSARESSQIICQIAMNNVINIK